MLGQRCPGQRTAQRGRDGARIQNLVGVESGERIVQHRDGVSHRNSEPADGVGKTDRRSGVQSANLDTAARGDLDDAVTVLARRCAKPAKRIERNRTGGQ